MNLNKAHKKAQREQLIKDVMKRCDKEIIGRTSASCLAATAQVLHDKFGFGKKRLTDYILYVYDAFDSISKDYVSFEDIKECIYKEIGIDFNEVEAEFVRRQKGGKE